MPARSTCCSATWRTPSRPTDKEAARAGLVEVAQDRRHGRHPALDPGQQPRLAVGARRPPTLVTEVGDKLDVIMVPKVEGAEDIHYVDRLLAQLEAKAGLDRPILVHAILETARRRGQRRGDLPAPARACRASRSGPADLAANRRMKTTRVGGGHPGYLVRAATRTPTAPDAPRATYQQDLWHYTLARMVDACAAHGILPYYGPFGDIKDIDRLRRPVPQRLPARLRRRVEPAPGADRDRQAGVHARAGGRRPRATGRSTRWATAPARSCSTARWRTTPRSSSARWSSSWPTAGRPRPGARRGLRAAEEPTVTDEPSDSGRAARCCTCPAPTSAPSRRPSPCPPTPSSSTSRTPSRPTPRRPRAGRRAAAAGGGYGRREVTDPGERRSTRRGTPTTCGAAAEAGPDAVVVPKVDSRRRPSRAVEAALEAAGAPDRTAIWAMVETPAAMFDARARSPPRPSGSTVLVMGTNDLAKELHAEHVPGRAPAAHRPVHGAARRPRRPARSILDGVYNDVKDLDGFEAECRPGRRDRLRRQDADPPEADRALQPDLRAGGRGRRPGPPDHRSLR